MHIFPDSKKIRVVFASRAEELLYEECVSQLKGDWRVYYSCNLSDVDQQRGLQDNEIDFVLYHPKWGLFVVEVKGGRVRYDKDARSYFSVDRYDRSHRIKNPFKQALVWKSRFYRYLKKRSVHVPMVHVVCLPSVDAQNFPEMSGVEKKLLVGRAEMNDLERNFIQIAEASHQSHYLDFKDVGTKLDTILVGSNFSTKLHIRDYIDHHELKVKDYETIYETLMTPIASREQLAVEGEAGTGKTLIAILLATHFRDQDQKVLLLSSNPVLNSFLKDQVGVGIEVETYVDFAKKFGVNLLKSPSGYEGSKTDWSQIDAPVLFRDYVDKLEENERFDVLICDEAQDVQPFWWDPIRALVKENGRFYLFFDRSQGVFGSGGSDKKFDPDEALPIPGPFFPLVHSYRTTKEIASFARPFRTGGDVLHSHCGRMGYVPEVIEYSDENDFQVQMTRLVRKLVFQEFLQPDEVTLLSAREPDHEASMMKNIHEIARLKIHRMKVKEGDEWKKINAGKNQIALSTISKFKGLETKVGIIVNISEYNLPLSNPIMSSLFYVACTRAKHMLYVFVKKDTDKSFYLKKSLDNIDHSGTMVVRGGERDFRLTGVVRYYNSDRVGWLRISENNVDKKMIMFFPEDVKIAGLSNLIEKGTKLDFRLQAESHEVCAVDLQLSKKPEFSE
ncbi:MAG: NERD domain-containing protein [Oligoflexales bacterium]